MLFPKVVLLILAAPGFHCQAIRKGLWPEAWHNPSPGQELKASQSTQKQQLMLNALLTRRKHTLTYPFVIKRGKRGNGKSHENPLSAPSVNGGFEWENHLDFPWFPARKRRLSHLQRGPGVMISGIGIPRGCLMRLPQNAWFIVENPMKMDDVRVPPF